MKITKGRLKKIIIQELNGMYGEADGTELARSEFQSANFEEDVTRIMGLLEDMETIIRENKLLKPHDIEYFKNHHLDNLMRKISFLEGVINARLGGKFDDDEIAPMSLMPRGNSDDNM